MKRSELKSVIKECLEELFEENDLFLRMMSEAIQTSISTTLKESLQARMPAISAPSRSRFVSEQIEEEEMPRNMSGTIKKQPRYINEKGKFNPASFLESGGIDMVSDVIKEEKSNSHEKVVQQIDQRVPDEEVFGDMTQFFSKAKTLIKGRKG